MLGNTMLQQEDAFLPEQAFDHVAFELHEVTMTQKL